MERWLSWAICLVCAGAPAAERVPVFARAVLEPVKGSRAKGTVEFAKTGRGLLVDIEVVNVSPGAHGIHVHENGDCSRTGGHFNPLGQFHGKPNSKRFHAGDLGNVLTTTERRGKKRLLVRLEGTKSFGGWDALVGRSVVLHAGRDDLRSSPDGESGPAVACGVIKSVDRPGR